MHLTAAVMQIYFYLQQGLDWLFMKLVSFIGPLSRYKRKHPFNEREKDDADELVKSQHVRRLLGTHQWQSALLVVGLPVTQDWFEMGCHLSPSLISIRLTA